MFRARTMSYREVLRETCRVVRFKSVTLYLEALRVLQLYVAVVDHRAAASSNAHDSRHIEKLMRMICKSL